jgi:flagellar protein FlaG
MGPPAKPKVAAMVGNSTSVTAAPAKAPTPAVTHTQAPTGSSVPAAGNDPHASGTSLPVTDLAQIAVDVERTVQRLNELMTDSQRSLRFQVDELSGRTVITVLDAQTKEVVRQIPSPEWLEVVRRLEQAGALIDERS